MTEVTTEEIMSGISLRVVSPSRQKRERIDTSTKKLTLIQE
jgi:hypothetical protein